MILVIDPTARGRIRTLEEAEAALDAAAPGGPGDHLLARYANDELLGEEKAALDAWLAASEEHQARLEEVRQELDQARAAMPDFEAILARGRALSGSEVAESESAPAGLLDRLRSWVMPHGSSYGWSPLAGAAALAALVLFVSAPPFGGGETTGPGSRTKSARSLTAFTTVAGETALVGPETALEEGDRVGLMFSAPEASRILLLSVDGRGTVSRLLPEEGVAAAAIERDWAGTLPFSLELDDAPGPEVFVGFFPTEEAAITPDEAARWLEQHWREHGEGLLGYLQNADGPTPLAATAVQKRAP